MRNDSYDSGAGSVGTLWAPGAPTPALEPAAPSGENGTDAAPVTGGCKCGAGPHPEHPDRCAAGHVLTGNGLAVVAGHRSVAFWNEHERDRRALQRAVVEDAGQTLATAPQALLLAADGLAQAVLVRDSAFARVCEAGGPLTSAGRTRRACCYFSRIRASSFIHGWMQHWYFSVPASLASSRTVPPGGTNSAFRHSGATFGVPAS